MERLIRENFMAEWQIRDRMFKLCNTIKREKITFWLEHLKDKDIDQIYNAIESTLDWHFYIIRTENNEL